MEDSTQSPLGSRSVASLSQALEDKISRNKDQATVTAEDDSKKNESGGKKKKKDAKPGPPKDLTTGRVLAPYGRPCLQCVDKGLKCTFLFAGSENDEQCAACRRQSATEFVRCVRQSIADAALLSIDIEELRAAAAASDPSQETDDHIDKLAADAAKARVRWNAVVRDHEAERDLHDMVYVNGEPISRRDAARNFAMPKPPPRPTGEPARGWRDVLPTPENRSFVREEADVEKILRSREAGGSKGLEEDKDLVEHYERIKYLQRLRRYQPRVVHLTETLPQEEKKP